jgi:hypothetical protein
VVVGTALNATTTFADTTVHLADASGAVRLTRLRGAIGRGDSVRVRATVQTRLGQKVLDDVTSTQLGSGFPPAVLDLTTAQAASAQGGGADARPVRVQGVTISDTLRTAQSFILTVSDGSGDLQVQLDRVTDGAFQPGSLPGQFVPGNRFDVTGLLAPTGTGSWRLKPRSASELTFLEPIVISIDSARALPAGTRVYVVGTALNSSNSFSDTTVHFADATGAVRLTRLRVSLGPGDSVRVRATTQVRQGQPVLDDVTTTALGQGLLPTAAELTTLAAAGAAGGGRDAQLVVVRNAAVSDTARVEGDYRLTVSDGSGDLEVLLDRQAGFLVPGDFVPGNSFDIVGVLVPTGSGTWRLKPRSAADLRKL